jgi:16S rRNA (cytosine967-C5)-methyltransferase
MVVVTGARRVHLADWAARGVAQVQDPTAATVVQRADLRPGQSVLDRCCGLGTKTLQMRDAVTEEGRILAIDPAEQRCAGLRQLVEARGIRNVAVRCSGMLGEPPYAFDRAIADVPCSNSGVLARRPEARYHQSAGNLRSLEQLQDRILNDTAPAVAPGGLLVYSTCSVWPEENRRRVDAFLSHHPEYALLDDHTTWPSFENEPTRYRDGGYVAVLARK